MRNYNEEKRILKQAIADNKLIIFVGAGVSANSGIPLWNDAIKMIREKMDLNNEIINENLKIPQLYYNARGKKEYTELVKQIFHYDDKSINDIHRHIVKLKPCNVITTNYDNLIEEAFYENGEFLDIIEQDCDIPYSRNNRLIIKMHGGFIHDNFVLKEDDYLNYSNIFPLIETYIKALIAKNVVLFIGYSYSDPDTKQIFNWVKNILNGNFQRAYLIDANNTYDSYIIDYYKNLGINILYTSEINPEFKANSHYNNTIFMLQYLMNETPSDKFTEIYNAVKPFEQLNYTLARYFLKRLPTLNMRIEGHALQIYDENPEGFNCKNCNRISKVDRKNKLKVIKNVINKSRIKEIILKNDKRELEKQYKFSRNKSFDEILHWDDTLDLVHIKNYVNGANSNNIDDFNQEKLRLAYCFYRLHMYDKTYFLLKELSLNYKKIKNYVWYFIVEFNRKQIAHYISKRYSFSLSIDEQTAEKIKNEAEAINLNEILYNNALGEGRSNEFLKELEQFTLMYQTLSEVLKSHDDVKKDAETSFVGNFTSKIDELETNVLDFYRYTQRNYLMIDVYSEVKEVYRYFIENALYSHSRKKQFFPDDVFPSGENMVLKELTPFMIIFICKYLNKSELEKIYNKNDIDQLMLSNDAEQVLFEIFDNYIAAVENKIYTWRDIGKFLTILSLFGKIKLTQNRLEEIFLNIENLISFRCIREDNFDDIKTFIIQQHNIDKNLFKESSFLQFTSFFVEKCLTNNEKVLRLFGVLSQMLHELFPNVLLEDSIIRKKISILKNEELVFLYLVSSDEIKAILKTKITEILIDIKTVNSLLYREAIRYNIIENNEIIENNIIEKLEELEEKTGGSIISLPDKMEIILNDCINIYLNEKIINVDKFKKYFAKYPSMMFLLDMNNFSYEKFNLKWLDNFNDELKKLISNNNVAHNEIKKMYKEEFSKQRTNDEMLMDYIKYFS